MADIARKCGVSRASVSRAFRNNRTHQSEETIQKILEVAREMGYDPNRFHGARRLASSKYGRVEINRVIGFFFFHFRFTESGYFSRVLQGVLNALSEEDFEIQTADAARIRDRGELPASYLRGDIDGIVTVTQHTNPDPIIEALRNETNFGSRPIVGLVEPLEGCSAVYPDNYDGACQAISHLMDLGHRNIAHFHSPVDPMGSDVHSQRLRAYADAYRERGLDPDKYLHFVEWQFSDPEPGRMALRDMLERHPEISAIIAHDDQQAGQLYEFLNEIGLRVPENISLLSYDDTDPVNEAGGNNILTTVRLPLVDVGREGTLLLIRRVLGEETEDRNIVLPTSLIVRGSTGKPNPAGLKFRADSVH